MTSRTCLILATLFGFFAVLLGAFGAHGLADTGYLERSYAETDPKTVAGMLLTASYKYHLDFQTAVRYHMWHALALLGIGLWMQSSRSKALSTAAWSFTVGILLFSGSLYILVIGGPKFACVPWGMVAATGGTALLFGWLAVVVAACSQKTSGD